MPTRKAVIIDLLKFIRPKRLAITFSSVFGVIWLFLEPVGLFLPEHLDWGWRGYLGLAVLSFAYSAFLNFPKQSVSSSLSSPDSTIEIKIGDLFNESGHLVIGTNDVFDTELGEVIKPSSVQGQFLLRIYHGDIQRLDSEINEALSLLRLEGQLEADKRKGKRFRYPIGTTIVLGLPEKRYFLNAYGYMRNDLRVISSADKIWCSLSCLWEQIRLRGHGLEVSIPVVGSDLARTNLPRMALIKLIAISFIAASKQSFVTNKLTVVIHPKDLESIDLLELKDFLKSACF